MSEFTLEISDTVYSVEIETSTEDNTENLEIATSTTDSVEITTGFAATIVYASDVVGLDNYLSNFIDSYNIDCGTP
jgi:chaperonin GroEL (HSP60 family)